MAIDKTTGKPISPTQHCTSKKCKLTLSHTAAYCGSKQKRRCTCSFDYPNG